MNLVIGSFALCNTVKLSKQVSLRQRKLVFLGHQILANGIESDPTKLSVLRNWLGPQNTKELRAILGLCHYYADFIPNLQQYARVHNQLTGKSKFICSLERESAFNELKFALTSSDVLLQFPDMYKPFELSTDDSDTGIGCILSHRDGSGRDQRVLLPLFSSTSIVFLSSVNERFTRLHAMQNSK